MEWTIRLETKTSLGEVETLELISILCCSHSGRSRTFPSSFSESKVIRQRSAPQEHWRFCPCYRFASPIRGPKTSVQRAP